MGSRREGATTGGRGAASRRVVPWEIARRSPWRTGGRAGPRAIGLAAILGAAGCTGDHGGVDRAEGSAGGGGGSVVANVTASSGTGGSPSHPLWDGLGAPRCPADMVLAGEVCIDRFEAPNEAGAEPLAFRTAYDGQQWCAQRGKRLCTDVEWERACAGASGTLYPYGDTWAEHACNDDKTWIAPDWDALATYPDEAALEEADRLYQADPSGSRPGCVSEAGVFDLTGNVAEWVVRTLPSQTGYDHVMRGCYWSGCYGGSAPSCTFVNPAHPGSFRSYEAGFRCCRDPLR